MYVKPLSICHFDFNLALAFFSTLFMLPINRSFTNAWAITVALSSAKNHLFLVWSICSYANQDAELYFFKSNMPMDTPRRSIRLTQTLSSWRLPYALFVVPVAQYKNLGQKRKSTFFTKSNKNQFAIAFTIQHQEATLFSTAHFTGIFLLAWKGFSSFPSLVL